MARRLAGIFGVILLLTGVVGLVLGEGPLLTLNIELVEDIIHLVTGGVLAFVGFGQRDDGLARNVLGLFGIVYVLVGLVGFVVPDLFGLLPRHGYSISDNIVHLGLGIVFLAVAYMSRGRETLVSR
jgi:hypothetical protein